MIFREGDRGDSLYVVVDGEVEVTRERPGQGPVPLVRLGGGDCFGEIALVKEAPRSATIRTCSRVDVLVMDCEAFQTLFAHLPPVRGSFERLIEQRGR